jgi:membrane-associated phospholipid phosphatase
MASTLLSVRATEESHPSFVPATRREILILTIYFLVIVAVADTFNIRLGAEALTLTVVIAAVAISRAAKQFVRDWWFFLLGLLLWRFSGTIAAQSPFPVQLDILITADRVISFGHDPVVLVRNALASPAHLGPLDWITAIAYNLHLPELYIVGYILWRLNREVYLKFVSAVLILLVLGFLTFVVFPTVPPWMASTRYHRIPGVVNGFGRVLNAHPFPLIGEPIFYVWNLRGDAVAAVPSEHSAFPMLEFLAFAQIFPRGAFLLLPWVVFVLFTVVYLGMHWLVDPLVGWAYAIVIFWFVSWFTRRKHPV